MTIKDPKFKIGQKVFHVVPDSDPGVIVNIEYLFAERLYYYQVAFDVNRETLWYFEHELSTEKNFL